MSVKKTLMNARTIAKTHQEGIPARVMMALYYKMMADLAQVRANVFVAMMMMMMMMMYSRP